MSEEISTDNAIWRWFNREKVIVAATAGILIFLFSAIVLPVWEIKTEIALLKQEINQILSYGDRISALEKGQQDQDLKIQTLQDTCIVKK